MRVLVERERRGVVDPSNGRVVMSVDRSNILANGWAPHPAEGAEALLAWSGTLAASLDESSPHNWMPAGRSALDAVIRRAGGALDASGARLLIEPHCRHVLSDPPSCIAFLSAHGALPVDVALAPASLLERSMLDAAEDHLERAFELLAPVAAALILNDVAPDPVRGDAPLRAVPLGEGLLPRDAVRRLVERFCADRERTPTIILRCDEDIDRQMAWLNDE